jgi:hypothetical protein
MAAAHVGCPCQVSPALPSPEPLRVTGPLPSLVLRTEDMWRKHNQCHRSWQGSQSGFPLPTLKCPLLCSAPSIKVLNTVHSWWRFLTRIEGGVMLMSHFICQTVRNTSYGASTVTRSSSGVRVTVVVFKTITSNGWQATGSQSPLLTPSMGV